MSINIKDLEGKTIASVTRYTVDFMAPHRERMGELYCMNFTDGTQAVLVLSNEYDSSASCALAVYPDIDEAADNFSYSHQQIFDQNPNPIWDSEESDFPPSQVIN